MPVKIKKMLEYPDNGNCWGAGSKTPEIARVAGFRNQSSAGSLHLLQSVCVRCTHCCVFGAAGNSMKGPLLVPVSLLQAQLSGVSLSPSLIASEGGEELCSSWHK